MTNTSEASSGADQSVARSPGEYFEEIFRELEVIHRRLGLLANGKEREGAVPTALLPLLPDDSQKGRLLSQVAADIYGLRRRRNRHLPSSLVGEPAWDLLLSFFMEPSKSLTVGNACLGADVPATTGLRWIALLEQDGFLQRSRTGEDRRLVILSLTHKGCVLMEECLGSMLSP